MAARFEELGWGLTPIGEVSLRRRRDPSSGQDVYEVKLGEEYLMSSLFTVAEEELARRALARLDRSAMDVVVGGLGLGYTALAALTDQRVAELLIVEALAPVIEWHRTGLVPAGAALASDARCRVVHGDFFAMNGARGFDPDVPDRLFDLIAVDIDHSPQHLLNGASAEFYGSSGHRRLVAHLRPGGVFALWSNDPPDPAYESLLAEMFLDVAAETVTFENPLQGRLSANTVYLATAPG
jgi:spermidine synthase